MSDRLSRIPGARIGMRYLYTSLVFWVCFNLGTLLWHQQFQVFYFREPSMLALTHLAALGWLTTGLMGIMYTTLPATLGVRPNSLRLAEVQYWLQAVGIAGLVLTMSLVPQARGRVIFGLLTLAALVIFVHNIAATVGRGNTWGLPEAHFIMAVFYLAITGLIGMSYIFYLNSGYVPQTMVSLKVHAHFAGLGWLALTLLGLTYKLLPVALGVDRVSRRWGLAASILVNLVFWGVFFSYAYDWPWLRVGSAVLGLAGLVCHWQQIQSIAAASPFAAPGPSQVLPDSEPHTGRPISLIYTQSSCLFGLVTTVLALLLTTGLAGDRFAMEYAYGYIAGAGWFGLYVVGQTIWLIQRLLHDEAHPSVAESRWTRLAFLGQLAGTGLAGLGLGFELAVVVVLGAALNLAASLAVLVRCVCVRPVQPVIVGR